MRCGNCGATDFEVAGDDCGGYPMIACRVCEQVYAFRSAWMPVVQQAVACDGEPTDAKMDG